MYLMIFEDYVKWKSREFSDEDRQAVDDGSLEIIDISDPDNPKEFYNGRWHGIKNYEELG